MQKLWSRQSACHLSTSLLPPQKARLEPVLTPDFMSSEESASESEPEGKGGSGPMVGVRRRRVFVRHPFPWRSNDLNDYFRSLDRKYALRQSNRGKEMMVKRIDGNPSLRSPPDKYPDWAVDIQHQ